LKLRVAFAARVIAFRFKSEVPPVCVITVPPAFSVVADGASMVLPFFKLIVAPARIKGDAEASLAVVVLV